ncbi:MAG: HDIG domain-containing metalloprotein [Anaerolineales bacterium]
MERETALALVREHVQNVNLVHHMLAVEAALHDYAPRFGGDPSVWALAGLLHDFDWEIHPTLEAHPQEGAPILRARGVTEEVIECILSHADHTGIPRRSPMQKALYACDEITGLITAVALVRPSHSLADLEVRSVRKKWSDSRFAANVDRSDIEHGAADLGVELWTHVGNVIESMRGIAAELGLAGG